MITSLPSGQTVTLDDMQMYYVDAGEGEPLLLLHGYTGASTDWAFYFDELTSQYRARHAQCYCVLLSLDCTQRWACS